MYPVNEGLEAVSDRTVLEIDLGAIRRNWRMVRDTFTGHSVGAVVKQDAYGFGASRIVPLLASLGCRDFWVVSFEEGLEIRALLPEARVFVLHGLAGAPVAEFRANALVPVLVDAAELPMARAEAARRGPFDVALQFDTGLTRLGLTLGDVRRLRDEADAFAGLRVAAYVTHLARFADPFAHRNVQQWRRFRSWSSVLPAAPLSFCASAGVFGDSSRHCALARVGSAIYGVETTPARPQPITFAARLTAPILRVMDVRAGVEVGYGGVYRTPRPSRLAHVAAGYGDGIPFSFRHQAHVRIGGRPAPIVGGVAMNLMTVDVTHLPEGSVRPGARVEFYGPDAPVDRLAAAAGIAPNALMVPTAHRAHRIYRDSEATPVARPAGHGVLEQGKAAGDAA
ncbi:alanine racemase [Azorhizobium oxalatiphilum]|uniref:alanine racemase n=1 Tax=Azorhizobium oxalatiphilum TaxID=980631 RepID=A0A917FJP3_9HYPH|nr:alanine racemase [Azorhizobium oxalatiphilum]GGF89285.1 alanine racemase [Azorhizobium oxalatiphilum]